MDKAKLKQRIIGAVVLLALAAIIIPIVFDLRREEHWTSAQVQIPTPPERGFVTRVLPLEEWERSAESHVASGQTLLAPPAEGASVETTAPAQNANPPAAAAKPGTPSLPVAGTVQPAPAVNAAAAVPAGSQAWVVQLGSFSSEKNAVELRERLRAKGYTAFVEKVGQNGAMVRVRVGPEILRSRADALRNQLEKDMQLKGMVVKYP